MIRTQTFVIASFGLTLVTLTMFNLWMYRTAPLQASRLRRDHHLSYDLRQLHHLHQLILEVEDEHYSYIQSLEQDPLEVEHDQFEDLLDRMEDLEKTLTPIENSFTETQTIGVEIDQEIEWLTYGDSFQWLGSLFHDRIQLLWETLEFPADDNLSELDHLVDLEENQANLQAKVEDVLVALADQAHIDQRRLWIHTGINLTGIAVLVGFLGLIYSHNRQQRSRENQWAHDQEMLTLELENQHLQLQHLQESWLAEIEARQQVEADRQVIQAEKDLSDLKVNFFALASHEFRTPLSAILVSTQLLESSPHCTEAKKTRNLRRIRSAAKTMTQLLADILTLSRAEAGKLEFNPQLLDLKSFCCQLVEEVKFNCQTQHAITIKFQGSPAPACLDEKLLRSILMSLLTNAIKYSPEEGQIQFMVINESECTHFKISDQGVGIPATDQHHLFESFHRGQNVGTATGTGLGLAVVKKCLELHGGTITVDSQVGVGSTFTVTIPWTLKTVEVSDFGD